MPHRVLNARRGAFSAWLDDNWIDNYPEFTEEERNAMTMDFMVDMVYEDAVPW